MADGAIREVERDPKEGLVVTVEEAAEHAEIPAPCAQCLSDATKRLQVVGVRWLEFPYCDACVPPVANLGARRATFRAVVLLVVVFLVLFVSIWFAVLALLILSDIGAGPRGKAVTLLLSQTGALRLRFQNEDYARLFVEENGAGMPP